MTVDQVDAAEPADCRPPASAVQTSKTASGFQLSQEQWGVWRQQRECGTAGRNVARAFKLVGTLDMNALRLSLREVARRHDILRASIVVQDGQPVHSINDSVTLTPVITDLGGAKVSERDALAQAWLENEVERPFELATAPLVRVSLARLGDDDHRLVVAAHPVMFADDRSASLLLQELGSSYSRIVTGVSTPLLTAPSQYAAFVDWQRNGLRSAEMQASLDYWTGKFATVPDTLPLPHDRPRTSDGANRRGWEHAMIAPEVKQGLAAIAVAQGATLFNVLLAAYQTLLRRYARHHDIVVVIPSEERPQEWMTGIIGHFTNLLAVRIDVPGDPRFPDFLECVQDAVTEANANRNLPFETLRTSVCDKHQRNVPVMARVAFSLGDSLGDELVMRDILVTPVAIESGSSPFDLALLLRHGPNGIDATLQYCADIFAPATAARLLRHFGTLLEGVVRTPQAKLSALPMLSQHERQQQLVEWNQAAFRHREANCLHELVEAQVRRTPDAMAVLCDGQSLTYRELNRRANVAARQLCRNGSRPGVLVGVCFERSIEMVVGILAVLKAGCAYVPVDPASPRAQIDLIVDDADIAVLLTHSRFVPVLPVGLTVICVDEILPEALGDAEDLGRIASPDDLAYVIYTSGSTGKPKGVMTPHRGICNTILSMQATFQLTPADRVLQRCAFIWDPSICEIFLTLSVGARLVMAPPDPLVATTELGNLIKTHRITCVTVVPSLLQTLLDNEALEDCTSLRHVFCGGEALPTRLLDPFFRQSSASLHNLYGPTEVSVWSTYWTCHPEFAPSMVPIGRPFSCHEVYILDSHLNPVPVGVVGELHIGGAGVARGYWARPELTDSKFIPHPFDQLPGSRLYKTGDLARYLPDGNIEYIGRDDFQVKIRGFRVELGEIEARLAVCPGVRNAVVVAREDTPGDKRLVAYLIAHDDAKLSTPDLRSQLSNYLPDFMVPSAFLVLDAFPETATGKLDRKALPLPQLADAPRHEAPVGAVEQEIASILQTVLGLDRVGRLDHFFFDLGGHSLLAARLTAMLRKRMGVDLPLASLFSAPTVAGLAELVAEQRANSGWRTGTSGATATWSPLVEITKANGRPPLFCIHGGKGNVLIFSDLARQLGERQPLFGLQARGIDGHLPAFNSVNEIVECYYSEIRRIQPTEPYFLLGYSVGGAIAVELAHRLSTNHHRVAVVALVDTICPPAWSLVQRRPAHERLARGLARGQVVAVQAARLSKWPRYYLAKYFAQRGRVVPLRLRENYVANALEIIFAPHRPTPYAGKIILFRALPEETGLGLEPELGWKDFAERVEVCYGQGTHDTIIRSPSIERLAEQLRELFQVEGEGTGKAAIRQLRS